MFVFVSNELEERIFHAGRSQKNPDEEMRPVLHSFGEGGCLVDTSYIVTLDVIA